MLNMKQILKIILYFLIAALIGWHLFIRVPKRAVSGTPATFTARIVQNDDGTYTTEYYWPHPGFINDPNAYHVSLEVARKRAERLNWTAQGCPPKIVQDEPNLSGRVFTEMGDLITNATMRIGSRIIHATNGWLNAHIETETNVVVEADGFKCWRGTMIPNSNEFTVQLRRE